MHREVGYVKVQFQSARESNFSYFSFCERVGWYSSSFIEQDCRLLRLLLCTIIIEIVFLFFAALPNHSRGACKMLIRNTVTGGGPK